MNFSIKRNILAPTLFKQVLGSLFSNSNDQGCSYYVGTTSTIKGRASKLREKQTLVA